MGRSPSPAPSAGLDASWWGEHETKALAWREVPKRKHSIPAEQVEDKDHTKKVRNSIPISDRGLNTDP